MKHSLLHWDLEGINWDNASVEISLGQGRAQRKYWIHSNCDDDDGGGGGDGHKGSDESEEIGGGELGETVKNFAQGLTSFITLNRQIFI